MSRFLGEETYQIPLSLELFVRPSGPHDARRHLTDRAMAPMLRFKVVLLGEGRVGKTSILLRYTKDEHANQRPREPPWRWRWGARRAARGARVVSAKFRRNSVAKARRDGETRPPPRGAHIGAGRPPLPRARAVPKRAALG